MKKIYVFDFDGTLIYSNETKYNSFISIAESHEEKDYIAKLLENKSFTRFSSHSK